MMGKGVQMDWITLIALACSGATITNKAACEADLKECVTWIADQPEVKAKDLSRDDVALWIQVNPKAKKNLCKGGGQ